MFAAPGCIVSLIGAFFVFGTAAGFLWIFVFGDNPWPQYTEVILPVLFFLSFLVLWVSTIIIGFITGKKLEGKLGLNKNHIMVSVAATILPIVFIILYQLSVGNIGPKSDGERCMDFCWQKGYSASSMPPRDSGESSCSCLDDSGFEIITVPIEAIEPVK